MGNPGSDPGISDLRVYPDPQMGSDPAGFRPGNPGRYFPDLSGPADSGRYFRNPIF